MTVRPTFGELVAPSVVSWRPSWFLDPCLDLLHLRRDFGLWNPG